MLRVYKGTFYLGEEEYRVEFSFNDAEPDVGIMREYVEVHNAWDKENRWASLDTMEALEKVITKEYDL